MKSTIFAVVSAALLLLGAVSRAQGALVLEPHQFFQASYDMDAYGTLLQPGEYGYVGDNTTPVIGSMVFRPSVPAPPLTIEGMLQPAGTQPAWTDWAGDVTGALRQIVPVGDAPVLVGITAGFLFLCEMGDCHNTSLLGLDQFQSILAYALEAINFADNNPSGILRPDEVTALGDGGYYVAPAEPEQSVPAPAPLALIVVLGIGLLAARRRPRPCVV